jgi:uncharacterized protein
MQRDTFEFGNRRLVNWAASGAARLALKLAFLCCAVTVAYASPPKLNAADTGRAPVPHAVQAPAAEVAFWESVRNSKSPAEIEAYLAAYPKGLFAPLARIRLKALRQSSNQQQPQPSQNNAVAAPPKTPESADRSQRVSARLGAAAGSTRGSLGIRISTITAEMAETLGLPNQHGTIITSVMRNSAAAQAGLRPLDVIVQFDGQRIVVLQDLPRLVLSTPAGTKVNLTRIRVAPSPAELAKRLEKRAGEGDRGAASILGWFYTYGPKEKQDKSLGLRWTRQAAEAGSGDAMHRLGQMYASGYGVTKDHAQAVSWYRKATEKNIVGAMRSLGISYQRGNGVTKDLHEAARWLKQAAEKGNPDAMYRVGNLYYGGKGVEQDDAQAVLWFRKAAEHHHVRGMTDLGWMYQHGRGVFKDTKQAAHFYRKATERNSSVGILWLGRLLARGDGVAKDETQAVSLFRRAMALGSTAATYELGTMYLKGKGIAKNEEEAFDLFRKAAEKKHRGAMHRMGWMLSYGKGTTRNYADAADWYRKAAALGATASMYNLGLAYERGWGVSRSSYTASEWVFKALKGKSSFAVKRLTEHASNWSKNFRRELQKRLRNAGVYDGPIDGSYGPGTKQAIKTLAQHK